MIQTITGTVLTTAGTAWANAAVEFQFDDGTGEFNGPGVAGVTDDDGAFSVEVYNNEDEAKDCLIRLPNDNVFKIALDPEDTTIDAGTLRASGGEGLPRLTETNSGSPIRMVTTTVQTNVGTKQALLAAVPTGKKRIVTQVVARNASQSLATYEDPVLFGFSSGADDFSGGAAGLQHLTLTTKMVHYPGRGFDSALTVGVAGDVFGVILPADTVTATLDIDTFYYDVDA